MFEKQKQEANEAARRLRARVAEVERDGRLSPVGKQEAVAEAQRAYLAVVERVQAEARAELEAKARKLPAALRDARAAEAAALRDILGESVRYDILARWVAVASPDELVSMARGASDDWERAVLVELGALRLHGLDSFEAERARGHLADVEASGSWAAKRVALEAEQRELENDGLSAVAALDVEAERARFADAYHVNAAYVEGA